MTKPVTPEVEIAALEAARKFFLKLHPLEKPDSVKSKTVIYWFFLAIAIASAALAALRTGPVFFESAHQNLPAGIAVIEALLAIVAIDIAAAVLAFFLVSEKSKRHGVNHDLGKVIFSTLIFCLIIQVAANLYSVAGPVLLTTGGHRTAELIIATLVGLAAPVVAYISGHGLGVLHVQHEAWIYDEMRDYEQKRQDLYSAFETWYDAKQRREWLARVQVVTGGETIQLPSVSRPLLMSVDSGQADNGQTNGHYTPNNAPRKSNAQDLVFGYLDANPNDSGLSSRILADRIGVGHESANKYRNEWLARVQVVTGGEE